MEEFGVPCWAESFLLGLESTGPAAALLLFLAKMWKPATSHCF